MEEVKNLAIYQAMSDIQGGYFRDAVIAFFLYTLELFDVVKEASAKDENMKINYLGKSRNVKLNSFDASEQLLNILLECLGSDERQVRINDVKVKFDTKETAKYYVSSNIDNDIQTLDDIVQYMDTLFVEQMVKNKLIDRLRQLIDLYKKNSTDSLWHRDTICNFLDLYFDILSCFICDDEIMKIDGISERAIKPLLNLGIRKDNNGSMYAEMTAPLVLSAMHLIYHRLDDYLKLDYTEGLLYLEDSMNNDLYDFQKKVYHDIFISKIFQIFRFLLAVDTTESLYHAALPAYKKCRKTEREDLRIPIRPLSTYSSYQGIRELRLGEKIVFEIERILIKKENLSDESKNIFHLEDDSFCIILVGDIAEEPLKDLMIYVEKRLEHNKHIINENNVCTAWEGKIKYVNYTMNDGVDFDEEKKIGNRSSYLFKKEDSLFHNSSILINILDQGDLLFFLDCCQLYRTEIQPIKNYLLLKQTYALDSYRNFYDAIKTDDMILDCKYMELYQMLTAYVWKGQLGLIKRYAREEVIAYIKDYIMLSGSKTAYLYLSDLDAFKQLRYVQEYMVRIEKYSQKQIGIVRISGNDSVSKLQVHWNDSKSSQSAPDKCLRFNLWQFVKHNVLNRREEFKRLFKEGEFYSIPWLNEVFIYLDYSDWINGIKVTWSIDTEDKDDRDNINFSAEKMESFIRIFFVKPFKLQKNDMYNRYIKDAYISFLYGTAMSIEDLVFLHILKRKPELLGEVKILGEKHDLSNYPFWGCKYSYKKIFWEVIEELDRSTPSLIKEYIVLEKVKQDQMYTKAIEMEEDAAIEECLKCILRACEGVNYTASALYTNCIAKLEGK